MDFNQWKKQLGGKNLKALYHYTKVSGRAEKDIVTIIIVSKEQGAAV